MVAFVKFDTFIEKLAEGAHNLGSDVLKIALTNTAPTAATDVGFLPDTLHPPPAAANGYTTGGHVVTVSSSAQASGTYKLVCDDVTITATGGNLGPFRYVILYNDTAASDEMIGYWDYGASVTLSDGVDFLTDFDASNGVVQLT